MTLQKKQVYLNKVLSKHYKKLKYTLFNKTKNLPALKTTAIVGSQSIGISLLTIGTINYKDFPGIIDVTALNGLKKAKKAVIIYEGKGTVPTTFTRSISKLAHDSKTQKLEEVNTNSLLNNCLFLKPSLLKQPLGVVNKMLGAGVCMHNYKLYFNSQLSLQNLHFLKREQGAKLKNLDHFKDSLILPQLIPEAKAKNVEAQNQKVFKRKEVGLSKMELSSYVTQVLRKIYLSKGQDSLGESVFMLKKLSNILGAFVETNSKIYFISGKELKQCGLAGGLRYSALISTTCRNNTPSKLENLVYSKTTRDRKIVLRTKCIKPNIIFFNFLKITTRTYVIHNVKRKLSKLINTISHFVAKH